MRNSVILEKFRDGEPVLITSLHLMEPTIFELVSGLGFDGIWVDCEHHTHSLRQVSEMCRAARVGRSDMVLRPARGELMRMGRMLEAGAQGIIYPRCETVEQAAEAVQWAKFPPMGTRGFDGGNADNPYCFEPMSRYLELANRQTFLLIQIETPEAVDVADAIAALPGVDGLFIGYGDLSVLHGIPGQLDHPTLQDARDRVADAAKQHGKVWGQIVADAAEARQTLDRGAGFVVCGVDLIMIKNGFTRLREEFRGLTGDLPSSLPRGSQSYTEMKTPAAE
jgi:4-hydroxy-2-oxoheptanedioate aldolase